VGEADLAYAVQQVENNWYYVDPSIRVPAKKLKPYAAKTKKEKDHATRPLPVRCFEKIYNMIRSKTSYAQRLLAKKAVVQSIVYAYMLLSATDFENLTDITVLLTAEDKKTYKSFYDMLVTDPRVHLVDCESDFDVEEVYANLKKLNPDLVMMNPPYDGSLHLEILEKVLATRKPSCIVVNLSPIRWLQDPLGKYKNSAFKKYKESIVSKITAVDIITASEAEKCFGAKINMNLGIYLFTDNASNTAVDFSNPIIDKILAKTNMSIDDVMITAEPKKYSVLINTIGAGSGGRLNNSLSYLVKPYNIGVYFNGKNSLGQTFAEYRLGNKKCKAKSEIEHIEFDTKLMCNNFYNSCTTKFITWLLNAELTDSHVQVRFLPWMGEITNPRTNLVGYESDWLDSDFCAVFGITSDEWAYIENYLAQY
jgi:hypothetical protein